jgi:hypothetical protein
MTDSILQGEFERFKMEKSGTGVPPGIHALDTRATFEQDA